MPESLVVRWGNGDHKIVGQRRFWHRQDSVRANDPEIFFLVIAVDSLDFAGFGDRFLRSTAQILLRAREEPALQWICEPGGPQVELFVFCSFLDESNLSVV